MNKFKWGHGFYTLNSSLLDAYAKCNSAEAVIECETRFRSGQESFNDNYTPNRDMPPSESSEDDDNEEENLTIENLSLKSNK